MAHEAAEYLATYVPRSIDAGLWNSGLGDFVRFQLNRLDLTDCLAGRLAWTLATHGAFCVSQGLPLEIEAILDPDAVERFCSWAKDHYRPSTAATMRSRLRKLGPLLTTKAPWEPSPPSLKRRSLSIPYSQRELDVILRDVHHQATAQRSRAATAITLLGLGAGLDARWICRVRGCDVSDKAGLVTVNVAEPSARIVVIRSCFATELSELAKHCGKELLVSSTGANGKNLVSNLCAKITIDRGRIHLNASRLRSSWLVAHLCAGTPMACLIKAAGCKGFGSFDDLLPFVVRPGIQYEHNAMASA
jgi:hypothetical protein